MAKVAQNINALVDLITILHFRYYILVKQVFQIFRISGPKRGPLAVDAKKSHRPNKSWTRAGAEAVKKGPRPGVKVKV